MHFDELFALGIELEADAPAPEVGVGLDDGVDELAGGGAGFEGGGGAGGQVLQGRAGEVDDEQPVLLVEGEAGAGLLDAGELGVERRAPHQCRR